MRIALVLAAALCLSDDAAAGWRYAEWGMSRDEVIAASDGRAHVHHEGFREPWGEYPAAKALAHEMGQSFEVWFYVDARHGLYAIRLVPTGRYWCVDIREKSMARWGYQVTFERGDPVWRDMANGNRISVIGYRGCTIKLEPLPAIAGTP